MLKTLKLVFLTILAVLCFQITIFATDAVPTKQKIQYDGTIINISEPIVNINGSIYVPIRTFCEKIGYKVDWTRDAIVISTSPTDYHVIREGTYEYVNSKGYIGLRKLGEMLNKQVSYNEKTATAILESKNKIVKEQTKDTTNQVEKTEPKKIKSSGGVVIMLDPGHGGSDPGAQGNGVVEKEVNLEIALKVKNFLETNGYHVLITRTDDTYVSLSDRYDYANAQDVTMFISIHNNSSTNSEAHGTEVLCNYGTGSETVATNILNALTETIPTTNRGLKDGSRMAVIKHTKMPAVIVESLFVSNQEDAEKLANEDMINKIAKSIYTGIVNSL